MRRWTYIVLAGVFLAAFAMASILPAESLLNTIAETSGVAALIAALFVLVRDQAAHERNLMLRRDDQQFNVGVTSHMANTVFDRHVAFCEEYIAEVNAAVHTLFRESATAAVLPHANNLAGIRTKHAAWLTVTMSAKLEKFEAVVRKLGADATFINSTASQPEYAETRHRAIERLFSTFDRVVPYTGNTAPVDEEASSAAVIEGVRRILDVERLVELRAALIERAHTQLVQDTPNRCPPARMSGVDTNQ
jgi:hypothetical protein